MTDTDAILSTVVKRFMADKSTAAAAMRLLCDTTADIQCMANLKLVAMLYMNRQLKKKLSSVTNKLD
jgi:hypothetical protein